MENTEISDSHSRFLWYYEKESGMKKKQERGILSLFTSEIKSRPSGGGKGGKYDSVRTKVEGDHD